MKAEVILFYEPGIVRGIDTSKGVIYMLTPVPVQLLEDVDLLLQGHIQIPTSLLTVRQCSSSSRFLYLYIVVCSL